MVQLVCEFEIQNAGSPDHEKLEVYINGLFSTDAE